MALNRRSGARGSTGGANGMDRGGRTGHRAVPGAVVAVGVVGALALAALALRPAEGLLHSGRGPLGQWGIVVIGASAAWTIGAWTAVRRLRPRFGANRMDVPPVEERLREIAAPLLLSATAVIGVLALVLHRFSTGDGTPGPPPPLATEPAPEPTFARSARAVRGTIPPCRCISCSWLWPRSSPCSSWWPSYGGCAGSG